MCVGGGEGGGRGIMKVWVVVCHRGPSPFFRQKVFSSVYPVYFLTLIPFLYKRLPVERDTLNSETLLLLTSYIIPTFLYPFKTLKTMPCSEARQKGLSLNRGGREHCVTLATNGSLRRQVCPCIPNGYNTSAMEIFGQNNYFYVLTRLISNYISLSPR